MNAIVDISNVQIETERLLMRPWNDSDLLDFYEYASVEGVGQMAGWMPHKSIEESKDILNLFIKEKKTFALELKENKRVIGSLGLEEADAVPVEASSLLGREIGYVLSRDYWGRGLMPEAVKAVIDYCFEIFSYDWLTCGHFVWNDQSRRVIEKCGFSFFTEKLHETRYKTAEVCRSYIIYNPQK